MRALRIIIVVLLVSLGFLGGYFVGWYLHGENTVRLSPTAQTSAKGAGKLQKRIVPELQTRYYRPVNADELGTAAIDGMLKSLKDPYTVYLDPQEAALLRERTGRPTTPASTETLPTTKDGTIVIARCPGSPPRRPGLQRRRPASWRSTASPRRTTSRGHEHRHTSRASWAAGSPCRRRAGPARRDVYLTRRRSPSPSPGSACSPLRTAPRSATSSSSQFAQDPRRTGAAQGRSISRTRSRAPSGSSSTCATATAAASSTRP